MGQQYQDTISSFAASPQAQEPSPGAFQAGGNNTPGKSIEQAPPHDGFGTRSSMYDNGMDVSAQPAPVSMPPQPQNQPATAGVNPSWAQQGRKRGGRAKRADGGQLSQYFGSMADQPNSLMRTGDTIKAFGNPLAAAQGAAPAVQQNIPPEMMRPTNISSVNTDVFPFANQQTSANQDPYERYLTSLYAQDFNRSPDPEGLKFWEDALRSGKYTPEQVAQTFMISPEYKTRSALAEQNALMPGVFADQPGTMDPFVAGYNARMRNAQALYGGIAQQNASQNTADQGEYQKQLEAVQAANQQRLAAAQQAKADRQAREAEAARQQQLMLMMMMMKH